jgi:hypothetical protein
MQHSINGLVNLPDALQIATTFEAEKTSFVTGNRPEGSCKHRKRGSTSLPAALMRGIILYECVVAFSDLTAMNVDLSFEKDNVRFDTSS